jgi:hypothetical protein
MIITYETRNDPRQLPWRLEFLKSAAEDWWDERRI